MARNGHSHSWYQVAQHQVDAAIVPTGQELAQLYATMHEQLHDLLEFVDSRGLLDEFAAAHPEYVRDVSD